MPQCLIHTEISVSPVIFSLILFVAFDLNEKLQLRKDNLIIQFYYIKSVNDIFLLFFFTFVKLRPSSW